MKSKELHAPLILLAWLLVGCITRVNAPGSSLTVATATPTPRPGFTLVTVTPQRMPTPLIQPPPADTPLCDIDLDPEQQVLLYTTTLYQRPPFYEGPIPLEFESAKKPSMGIGLGSPTIINAFDEWTTFFDYADPSFEVSGIATCAQTLSESGQLLAEARFEEIVEGTGIIILEVHYSGDGSVQFWCKSQIDFGLGFKRAEIETHGKKTRDYYFTWPVMNH